MYIEATLALLFHESIFFRAVNHCPRDLSFEDWVSLKYITESSQSQEGDR